MLLSTAYHYKYFASGNLFLPDSYMQISYDLVNASYLAEKYIASQTCKSTVDITL